MDAGSTNYPKFGENIVLYSDAKILGKSNVGNNVMFSANTYVINENIPNNCIVFGQSPNLVIKKTTEEKIFQRTKDFWKWDL